MDPGEPGHQIFQKRGRIGRVPDFRRHDEPHPPARLQKHGGRHEKGRPRRGQARKHSAVGRAQIERALADRAGKIVIADEGRVAGGALKSLRGLGRPGKEIPLVHQGPWRGGDGGLSGGGILFDTHRMAMQGQELTVPAGRIDQPIRGAPQDPGRQGPGHVLGREERARPLLAENRRITLAHQELWTALLARSTYPSGT